jgi:hypothetical protein
MKAAKRGLEFTISKDDIVLVDVCPVLGIPLLPPGSTTKPHDNSLSIDRLDSSKGYIPGNISVMSVRANKIKNDGTAEEHEKIAKWMREKERESLP